MGLYLPERYNLPHQVASTNGILTIRLRSLDREQALLSVVTCYQLILDYYTPPTVESSSLSVGEEDELESDEESKIHNGVTPNSAPPPLRVVLPPGPGATLQRLPSHSGQFLFAWCFSKTNILEGRSSFGVSRPVPANPRLFDLRHKEGWERYRKFSNSNLTSLLTNLLLGALGAFLREDKFSIEPLRCLPHQRALLETLEREHVEKAIKGTCHRLHARSLGETAVINIFLHVTWPEIVPVPGTRELLLAGALLEARDQLSALGDLFLVTKIELDDVDVFIQQTPSPELAYYLMSRAASLSKRLLIWAALHALNYRFGPWNLKLFNLALKSLTNGDPSTWLKQVWSRLAQLPFDVANWTDPCVFTSFFTIMIRHDPKGNLLKHQSLLLDSSKRELPQAIIKYGKLLQVMLRREELSEVRMLDRLNSTSDWGEFFKVLEYFLMIFDYRDRDYDQDTLPIIPTLLTWIEVGLNHITASKKCALPFLTLVSLGCPQVLALWVKTQASHLSQTEASHWVQLLLGYSALDQLRRGQALAVLIKHLNLMEHFVAPSHGDNRLVESIFRLQDQSIYQRVAPKAICCTLWEGVLSLPTPSLQQFLQALAYVKMDIPFWLTHSLISVATADRTLQYYDLPAILRDWLEADWTRRPDTDGPPRVTIKFTGSIVF